MLMRFVCFLCFFISVSALASIQEELVVSQANEFSDMSPKAFFELCESINTSQEIDINSVSPSVLYECRNNVKKVQTGSQSDSVEFESIWLSDTEIDVTDQSRQVTYELELSTEGAAITQACMRIEPSNDTTSNQGEYACFYNFVELSTPGHYVASTTETFSTNAVPDVWSPTIYQTRNANNVYQYEEITPEDMRNAGEDPDLTIVNNNTIDSEAPTLRSVELSSYSISIDDSSVEVAVKVTAEDVTGVRQVYMSLQHEDNAYRDLEEFVSLTTWEENEDGVFESEATVEFGFNTPPGNWVIDSIQINDTYRNYVYLNTDDIRQLEIDTDFIVENDNEIDAEAPFLESLEFSVNTVTVTSGVGYANLSAVITDGSDLSTVVAVLEPPTGSGSNNKYEDFYNFERSGDEILATKFNSILSKRYFWSVDG